MLATQGNEEGDSGVCRFREELEAFRMVSGGEANWRVARDEGLQHKLLEYCADGWRPKTWGRRTWMGSSKVSRNC